MEQETSADLGEVTIEYVAKEEGKLAPFLGESCLASIANPS
jgi:hypothetical protein